MLPYMHRKQNSCINKKEKSAQNLEDGIKRAKIESLSSGEKERKSSQQG